VRDAGDFLEQQGGRSQRSLGREGVAPARTVAAIFSFNSRTPPPALATVERTGTPKAADMAAVSIVCPFFSATSAMFKAMTVGQPSSMTCVAK
jgi:hypothetical protein